MTESLFQCARASIAVAAASIAVLAVSPAAAQDCSSAWTGLSTCSAGTQGRVSYRYDAAARAFYPVRDRTGGTRSDGGGPAWQVREIVQTCEPSDPDNPSDNLCTATFCTTSDGQRGFWVRIFRRRDDSENWQPWPAAGGGQLRECVTAAEPVSLDEVRDALLAILEEKYTTLAAPRISLQPPATAIVNMPVIASTADAGQHGFDIDNPLPGRVAITPSYAWTWSNGDTSTGPGRAYDPAVNPLTTPQHYTVRATYSDSGPGRVELQATWDVALTVPGAGTVTDIEPLVFTTDADFRVAGARTVLVD